MNILLVGEEAAGIQALRLVHAGPHRVVAVLTGTDRGQGEESGVTVASVAGQLGVPVRPAALVKDSGFADELRRDQVDVLLNVHSLYLIDAHVVAAPRIGCFNLHPGPLPGYAGLSVPSWAIYLGEIAHGVTLHWMDPEVDTGPIAFSASFPLAPSDTGLSVSAACVQHGIPLIAKLLAYLAEDPASIPAVQQDLTRRRYFRRGAPHGGWIPWERSAKQVVDFVRACDYGPFPSPWGVPKTRLSSTEISIGRVRTTGEFADAPPGTVGTTGNDGIRVATRDEWVVARRLRIDRAPVPDGLLIAGDVLTTDLKRDDVEPAG